MKRTEFLKGVGILGVGAVLPISKAMADTGISAKSTGTCVLIPSETEGPFPLDLSTTNSAKYFRQDVREGKAGVELRLKMRITGLDNCLPMNNVRVNIWHCDKDGIYSGYNNAMNAGDVNATFLRGYQMTNAYGEADFVTIFPGWYSGRLCHIHFQVYVSSVYKAVSQMTFDIPTKNALYTSHTSVYTKGADPMTVASDNVFSDGVTYQMATLTANADGSYSSVMEVTINGSGAATGIKNYEGETGGHFKLGQNFPNPHNGHTTIPFTLATPSQVAVEIYDLSARKVATINKGNLSTGDYDVAIDFDELGIASDSYLYQLQVSNSSGIFRQAKMMTAAQ